MHFGPHSHAVFIVPQWSKTSNRQGIDTKANAPQLLQGDKTNQVCFVSPVDESSASKIIKARYLKGMDVIAQLFPQHPYRLIQIAEDHRPLGIVKPRGLNSKIGIQRQIAANWQIANKMQIGRVFWFPRACTNGIQLPPIPFDCRLRAHYARHI
jgi:hypothetical protein